jgi:hypothetical protein
VASPQNDLYLPLRLHTNLQKIMLVNSTVNLALIPLVRDGHTLESMVEQTPQNNNGKQEINTQYLRGSAVCLHPRD